MRDGQKEIWEQAIRLARALDNASAAGNDEAAKMHGAALLEKLKELLEIYNG